MDSILKAVKTRDIIKKYGFKFSKSLGQNFLIDDGVLEKIIEASEINKDSNVLEVGPGIGTLTVELSEHAGKVLAVEIDDDLIPILQDVFKDYSNIHLLHDDAMKIDLKNVISVYLKEPVSICANIPYYITTPLITKFFKSGISIKNIVLMVQREVADRMAAVHSTKEYGALSLLVQYYSKPSIVAVVPPQSFIPSPKVDSVVIKLEVYEKPVVDVKDENFFFKIIRESFNQRRKTLSNCLRGIGLPKDELMAVFDKSSIDPVRRGETLSLQEFAVLSNNAYDYVKKLKK